jgi:hypothetical protein
VAVGIVEERHLQIVIIHCRDQVRPIGESDAPPFKLCHSQSDIRAPEVNASLRTKLQPIPYLIEQEAHSGAIEERQITEAIELSQANRFLVEGFSAINVDHRQGKLANLIQIEQHCSSLAVGDETGPWVTAD